MLEAILCNEKPWSPALLLGNSCEASVKRPSPFPDQIHFKPPWRCPWQEPNQPRPHFQQGQLSKYAGDPLENASEYWHLVGALQHCTLARPNISFVVNQLYQFMHSPTTTYWTAAKKVLRYLKGSINHGLQFGKGTLHLNAYNDSHWARNPDDRRSTTSFALFLGPWLINWCAKKQPVVSKSSIEAENRSLAFTTAKLCWLRMLFKELGLFLHAPPTLSCNNLGALALASNPIYHACIKHIEVDYHFIYEKVVNKDEITRYLPTPDQLADISTKGLTTNIFLFLHDKLRVCSPPISLQGDVKHHITTLQEDTTMQIKSSQVCTNHTH